MRKRIAILITFAMLMLAMLACGAQIETPIATPTVINPGEIALTMIMQKADAEATQMMVNVQLTATGQVLNVTATAQAYQFGIATNEQTRKDAQATDARQRQDAAATEQRRRDDAATEQARKDAEATAQQYQQNVIGTATAAQAAIWNGMTMQAAPTHDMWTKQAVEQEQIIATNQVELSNLEVERQRKSNTLDALWKYAVATLAVGAAIIVAIQYSHVREIKNGDGETEVFVIGGKHGVKPALLSGPVFEITPSGVTIPLLGDAANQAEIVRRAQGVEAIRAIPPNTSPQLMGDVMTNILGGIETAPRFQILEAHEAPPVQLVDAEALKSLEQDWKETADGQF